MATPNKVDPGTLKAPSVSDTRGPGADDDRLKRSDADPRRDRESDERELTENRELTESERLEDFQQAFFAEALPSLPEIPGFHVCWLTTNNPRDTVQMRMRLGYVPIKGTDVPGWEHSTVKSGEYEGLIGVNEMLAFKLPNSLYQKYMAESFHHAPQREDEKLKYQVDQLRDQAQQVGAKLIEGDGMRELGKPRPVPRF